MHCAPCRRAVVYMFVSAPSSFTLLQCRSAVARRPSSPRASPPVSPHRSTPSPSPPRSPPHDNARIVALPDAPPPLLFHYAAGFHSGCHSIRLRCARRPPFHTPRNQFRSAVRTLLPHQSPLLRQPQAISPQRAAPLFVAAQFSTSSPANCRTVRRIAPLHASSRARHKPDPVRHSIPAHTGTFSAAAFHYSILAPDPARRIRPSHSWHSTASGTPASPGSFVFPSFVPRARPDARLASAATGFLSSSARRCASRRKHSP